MRISSNLIRIILTTIFILGNCAFIFANDNSGSPTGTIKGKIRDMETKAPAPGVTVALSGTKKGAYSDLDGNFVIKDVPVGSYILQFSSIAFEPLSKTDIIVRPERITYVDVEMKTSALELEGVEVRGGYFAEEDEQPVSTTSFSGEQVRRAPGSGADVLRIISSLPSVAKVDDQTNSLAVRGGSPFENGLYLDGMEIDNISHFAIPGSSGGSISMINVDLLRGVNFSAGGFGASHGDKLSSIMQLDFREGNREEFDGQLDLNFAGFGAILEGPFADGRGSYLLTAKRSYLDLVVDMIGVGIAPRMTDYQGKIAYNIASRHSLTITGLGGYDYMDYTLEQGTEDGNDNYGITKGYSYAIGANWRFLWGKYGYSNTNISFRDRDFFGDYFETKTERQLNIIDQLERTYKLRNTNYLKLNNIHSFEFGIEGSLIDNSYNNYYAPYTNLVGDSVETLDFNEDINSYKYGGFISYISKPIIGLTAVIGIRYDYFEYNDNAHASPRVSLRYDLTASTAISASTGIYYQNLPGNLLAQRESYKELEDPRAYHYVVGIEQLLRDDTKLSMEGYFKQYEYYPMDSAQPNLFILDELTYAIKILNFAELVDTGEAESYGVELTLQKKLVKGIYGLVSGSIFKTRYKGLDGKWYDRNYDNRVIFSAEGGYKPNHKWELSARWVFAGGRPYTPLDTEKSREINHTVLDDSRINAERYPDYHSLNLRADRRFSFSGSNMVVFLSLWNAYSRKNVSTFYWNEIEQKADTMYQWTLLPIFGIEYEF